MKKAFSKKSLAFLLALAVVLSSMMTGMAVIANAEETAPVIWGGQEDVATGFAGGDGSKANPYQISNGAELAYFSSKLKE